MEMLDRWPHASHRRTASRQKLPEPLPARLWGVVARPAGMRRATHGRLVRKHNRLLQRLQLIPYRPFPERVRTLLRWSAAGRIETWQTPGGHRRFRARDLARLREAMRA